MSETLGMRSECPKGVKWIYSVFGDCVTDTQKQIGFWIGLVSLCLWVAPLVPQFIENCNNKRAEGISIYLLLLWLFGDICNLIGSILSKATPLMKIIAGYYIIHDLILLGQLFYYGISTYKGGAGGHRTYRGSSSSTDWFWIWFLLFMFLRTPGVDCASTTPASEEDITQEATGLQVDDVGFWRHVFVNTGQTIGFALGVIAGLCYIASRIPQIRLNGTRKSCQGVSVLMFYILVLANITYCISVLLQSTGWVYVVKKSPWLISYVLCGFLDAFIIGQYYHYGTGPPTRNGAEQMEEV